MIKTYPFFCFYNISAYICVTFYNFVTQERDCYLLANKLIINTHGFLGYKKNFFRMWEFS
jgi:hypothetical protein